MFFKVITASIPGILKIEFLENSWKNYWWICVMSNDRNQALLCSTVLVCYCSPMTVKQSIAFRDLMSEYVWPPRPHSLTYIHDFRFLNNVSLISLDVSASFNDCCGEKIVCARFNYEDEKTCVLFLESKHKHPHVHTRCWRDPISTSENRCGAPRSEHWVSLDRSPRSVTPTQMCVRDPLSSPR